MDARPRGESLHPPHLGPPFPQQENERLCLSCPFSLLKGDCSGHSASEAETGAGGGGVTDGETSEGGGLGFFTSWHRVMAA